LPVKQLLQSHFEATFLKENILMFTKG
jgi:hypothetical protein